MNIPTLAGTSIANGEAQSFASRMLSGGVRRQGQKPRMTGRFRSAKPPNGFDAAAPDRANRFFPGWQSRTWTTLAASEVQTQKSINEGWEANEYNKTTKHIQPKIRHF